MQREDLTNSPTGQLLEEDYKGSIESEGEWKRSSSVILLGGVERSRSLTSIPSFGRLSEYMAQFSGVAQTRNSASLLGPRRCCCVVLFGVFLPALLIATPLYAKMVLFPPKTITMAPTDQRLFYAKSSGVWCKGQHLHMNGSFNAYLLSSQPPQRSDYETHIMSKHLTLKDDVKEYWGFYLLKNSVVNIKLCAMYDGGMLMILRGANNLHKCAWIGEKDSAEQDEDHNDESNESGQLDHVWGVQEINKSNDILINTNEEETEPQNSEERRMKLNYYLQKALRFSKSNNELLDKIQSLSDDNKNNDKIMYNKSQTLSKLHDTNKNYPLNITNVFNINKLDQITRLKRDIESDYLDVGGEELNDLEEDDESSKIKFSSKNSKLIGATSTTNIPDIYKLPKGLLYERGTINQLKTFDFSNEEHMSSYSSSEEALSKCEGLLGSVPLYSTQKCNPNFDSNRITYRIPITGTYYFVFSSDNEVFETEMFFNLTLHRIVYETKSFMTGCHNESDCELPFSFFSQNQAVVEVPEKDDWNNGYLLESICQPRVPVYLSFAVAIPIVILLCAFQ